MSDENEIKGKIGFHKADCCTICKHHLGGFYCGLHSIKAWGAGICNDFEAISFLDGIKIRVDDSLLPNEWKLISQYHRVWNK
jgi:hypothetical protein